MNDGSSRNLLPTPKVGAGRLFIWAHFTIVRCEISTRAPLGWRWLERNTLRDFIDIELGLGLQIYEAQVDVGSNPGTGGEEPKAGVSP